MNQPTSAILTLVNRSPFILPSSPLLRDRPPTGVGWLHEVKFDGWRVQLHKSERGAAIYTRNAHDYTSRLPSIAGAIATLSVQSVIIDGELTVCDDRGFPDFRSLHFRRREHGLCVWAFDLLHLNGKDLRALPLTERKAKLEKLVYKARDNWLRFSENFDDGVKLLASCERVGLEGIVSNRKDAPYRSGKGDWIKVKSATWREANKDRH